MKALQKFIAGSSNTKIIKEIINGTENLDLAVAFWGEEIISTLRKNFSKYPHRRLRIICNLESGAVNPLFVRFCLKSKQIQIKTNSRLHSKVLLTENEYVVGSTNISSNGLGHEDEETIGWMESSIAGTDRTVLKNIQIWFSKEWNQASGINESSLKQYEELWLKKRSQRQFVIKSNPKKSLLEAVIENVSLFKDKKIYLAIYREPLSDEGEKKFNEIKKQEGIKDAAPYEEWDLPEDAYLIDIYFGKRNKIMINEMSYIAPSPLKAIINYEDGETGQMIFGKRVKNIEGYSYFCKDEATFKKVLPIIWKSIKDNGDEEGRLIRIDRLPKFFKQS